MSESVSGGSALMEGWGEIRKALIRVSRIWQHHTYGPLIGPKTPEQERNVREGVHRV